MRRSAAPSQANNVAKRPKFVPPVSISRPNPHQISRDLVSSDINSDRSRSTSLDDFTPSYCDRIGTSVVEKPTDKENVEKQKGNFSEHYGSSLDNRSVLQEEQVVTESPGINSSDHQDVKFRKLANSSVTCLQRQSDDSLHQLISSTSGSPSFVGHTSASSQNGQTIMLHSVQNKARSPLYRTYHQRMDSVTTKQNVQQDDEEIKLQYFSVVWCKLSKKKHKKWEGDAVLSTKKRSATMYDMEGKIIGKGTGYKVADLESLKEDETLVVGGKEILVMSRLTEEHFKSGKCFTATGSCVEESSAPDYKNNTGTFKPFVNPMKSSSVNGNPKVVNSCDNGKTLALTSRHDASLPNALVMPRPSGQHQWKSNRQGFSVIDVVVDPYLSTSLRSHQRDGIVFLYECMMGMRDYDGCGAILADDMGLGKTLQSIALIWTLLKQGPYGKPVIKKILVVTPGSLVKNWYQEFKKWLGLERLSVFALSADNRIEDYLRTDLHPVLITSYEMFVRCHERIKEVAYDLVVCDEGHRLKNTAIKTTSLLMSLPCRRRVVLTGTPIQNDLQEFYSIVEFCNPGVLGSSAAFRRVFEDPIVLSRQPKASKQEQELGQDRAEELTRLTQMFVLRRTQEINNDYLPSKVELVLFCRLSPLQHLLYRQLTACNLVRQCLRGNLTGSPHLICIGALKQLCNHPGLVYKKAAEAEIAKSENRETETKEDSIYAGLLPGFPVTFDPSVVSQEESGKLQVLSGILSSIWSKAGDEKVVLVSNHTKTLDFLQVFCNNQGYTYLRLDGKTPTAQRLDIVNRFNNRHSPHRMFLLSSKAGGVGLNLIGASRLILYDIDWNPANDLQAMARVWRDGQKRKVHIYRLLTTGTIEEKIYQRQIAKQGLSGAVMDTNKKNNVQFSVEELKNLFSLNDKTDCETHNMLQCRCKGDPLFTQENAHAELADERPCQLGKPTSDKMKSGNLTMAELQKWKHLHGDFVDTDKTWCLEQATPAVSFMFWHESNSDGNTLSS